MSANTRINLLIVTVIHIVLTIAAEIEKEVKLVSVVFRHGDRTPDIVYPNMPYTDDDYFPDGVGGLTNKGKGRAFHLGEVLRRRYNQFLGPVYYPDIVFAQSTDYIRTKMTLQLVLAGLYPPTDMQKWKSDLNWQPIPTIYIPEQNDKLLLRTYTCNSYLRMYENLKKNAIISESLKRFDPVKEELTNITGWRMNDIYDLYTLHCNIVCLNYMKKELPEWTNKALGILSESTTMIFDLLNYNNHLKKLNGGALLRKVSEDMELVANGDQQKHKIFLYSSHDLNVYAMLASLNVVQPHLPEFTSAVIIELFTIKNKYYVQVLHYLGIPPVIKPLEIPNCPSPCPLHIFSSIIKDVIPSNEELNC